MYYLKYRPQTIDEIDNKEIRTSITTLLSSEAISHAWLLTGPKGTGKTSTARLIAKVVNCENNSFAKKGNSFEPCNTCANCMAITKGSAIDVIEMDAASNRKIDDIRTLIAEVPYAPAHMRNKVYIIDEVHMLTTEAFNALLKTLEEPPASTIFILATTEVDKLPKTIISRCRRLQFSKAKPTDVARQLSRIAKGEGITVKKELIDFIALHCDDSFRDAAKLFEEVVTHNIQEKEELKKFMGLAFENERFLTILSTGTLEEALAFLDDYDKKGGSSKVLIESLLDSLHSALLVSVGVDTSGENYALNPKQIGRLMRLFTEAYNLLKISPRELVPLEAAVIDYFSESK